MTTLEDDCEFICIPAQEYNEILNNGEDALEKEEDDDGIVVKVSEVRRLKEVHVKILLRATPEKLMENLLEDKLEADPYYMENFLLCQRKFMTNGLEVMAWLLEWFDQPEFREKMVRIVISWVGNHFSDFESNPELMDLLEQFENKLEGANMKQHLLLLNLSCTENARTRVVVIKKSKGEDLDFTIAGGRESGIFVQSVNKNSLAYQSGLMRGDQIFEVNGHSFQDMIYDRALELLQGASFQLKITVKSNVAQFKKLGSRDAAAMMLFNNRVASGGGFDNSLKIYRTDNTFCYILVSNETNAREVIKMALQEFKDTKKDCDLKFGLFEISCIGSNLRTSRMFDTQIGLAQRLQLARRYYVREVTAGKFPPEILQELTKEGNVGLLDFSAQDLATFLLVKDFTIFKQIGQLEYVDNLENFEDGAKFSEGSEFLEKFSRLFNQQSNWVIVEIVLEESMTKRSLMMKKFIKIAQYCKEMQNYNSMHAILCGLEYSSVMRLRQTWAKVPEKAVKLYKDLLKVMDSSRKFNRYREMVKTVKAPLIPIFPIVSGDFAALQIQNKSKVDGLINFEKMRKVSKEVDNLQKMCNARLSNIPNAFINMNDQASQAAMPVGIVASNKTAQQLYEEALVVRKIKAYLEKVDQKVSQYTENIDNWENEKLKEKEIEILSKKLEPPNLN